MINLDNARAAYGDTLPDWVEALARECDRTSGNRTAKTLGYSASAISNVIHNQYKAATGTIEQAVRGALMKETVTCPMIGEIGKDKCLHWRKQAKLDAPANTLHVRMSRACTRCPHNQEKEQ
ncbi:MAG: hypothetical protein ACRBB0_25520 [Pelagimonas sp.]|uniref:hypothetical protein n=1 Tax=Pelagimonas sp. TaxID=2073170 RepID=UPI003D6B93C0